MATRSLDLFSHHYGLNEIKEVFLVKSVHCPCLFIKKIRSKIKKYGGKNKTEFVSPLIQKGWELYLKFCAQALATTYCTGN